MGKLDQYILIPEEVVLLIIDIQDKLVSAMKYGEQVIRNTKIMISLAQELGIPIILTEQYPKGLGKTVPDIKSNILEPLIYEKTAFSGCNNEINSILKRLGRKKILITGMETHVCVFQTVRDLLIQDYQVFVVKDAMCSRFKENYRNGLFLMTSMGAVVTDTETILFDLIKEAGTPLFKKLSKLIK